MRETSIKIPAELFALAESSRFEGAYDLGALTIGPDDYRFDGPVCWSVDVTNTGSALLVSGTVAGKASCACSRCLGDVDHDFEGRIEGYFIVDPNAVSHEEEEVGDLEESEFEVLPDDHVIDLAPLIEAALFIDAPDMPLCCDECAGLCPQCGANLNEGPCGCGQDPELVEFDRRANPFAALAGYEFK